MRRHYFALIALVLAASIPPVLAQATPQPAADATQAKLDALLLYSQGRDLETAGKQADAQAKFAQAVSVCDQELAADPKRLEAYVVKCWSLFRVGKHADVISTGQAGM